MSSARGRNLVESQSINESVDQELVSLLRKTKRPRNGEEHQVQTSSNESISQLTAGKRTKKDDQAAEGSSTNIGKKQANQRHKTAGGGNAVQKKATKPRRRVATLAQRRAANIRERRRMFNLNAAFDRLRKKVPSFAYEKRLSRIETLKLAIMYIKFMDDLVNDDVYAEKYKQLQANATSASFLASNTYLSLYGHCNLAIDDDDEDNEYISTEATCEHRIKNERENKKQQMSLDGSMIDESLRSRQSQALEMDCTGIRATSSATRASHSQEIGDRDLKLGTCNEQRQYATVQSYRSLSGANFSGSLTACGSISSPTLSSASSCVTTYNSSSTTSPPARCHEPPTQSHHHVAHSLITAQERYQNVTLTRQQDSNEFYIESHIAPTRDDVQLGVFCWDERVSINADQSGVQQHSSCHKPQLATYRRDSTQAQLQQFQTGEEANQIQSYSLHSLEAR